MEFDDEWINNYEISEKDLNNDLFECDVDEIKFYFLYCNTENELIYLKTHDYKLKNTNFLSKEELTKVIRDYRINNNIKYLTVNILKYNINLKFLDVEDYLNDNTKLQLFLKSIKLKNVQFQKSIKMFQSLNSIFLLFHENHTKLKQSNTKKIELYSHRKKTKRKQLKDIQRK
jgi:hypothetical protein